MNIAEKVYYEIQQFLKRVDEKVYNIALEVDDWIQAKLLDPSLEQTLLEKNGKGPHGYGDPRDASVSEVEHYLFPRMIWKKIRYEKCNDVTEKYYSCLNRLYLGEDVDCKPAEDAMYSCKNHYYKPENIDAVERECIVDYIQLRSKFRETGSEDDLWQLKMLMLQPAYNEVYKAYKKGASMEELEKLLPPESGKTLLD